MGWPKQQRACGIDGCENLDYYAKDLCRRHYNQAHHQANRETVHMRQKARYEDNLERERGRALDYYYANRDAATAASRRYALKKFGITPEEYDLCYEEQRGLCAICSKPERVDGRLLAVDHDHATGVIRGLLCGRCNTTLGRIEDDPEIAQSMANYLRASDECE